MYRIIERHSVDSNVRTTTGGFTTKREAEHHMAEGIRMGFYASHLVAVDKARKTDFERGLD